MAITETDKLSFDITPQSVLPFEGLFQQILFSIINWGTVVFMAFYFVISIVLLKQIRLMSKTIYSSKNIFLYILGYIHLFIVIATFIFVVSLL
jgi:hypothetical protein